MEKISINSIYPFKKCISRNEASSVFKIDDNTLFKRFNYDFIVSLMDNDYDIEEKILDASELVKDSNIVVPSKSVYGEYGFVGYTMPFIDGVSLCSFYDSMSLSELTDLYCKIESIVKRNNDIVFPDMITDGNILVDKNCDVHFIDFDGLQISNYLSPAMSSGLGNRRIYNSTKYKCGRAFTKELDIKSLVFLYFSMIFNYPLENIDALHFNSSYEALFGELFDCFGIDDDVLYDKILRLYGDQPNQYIGDTVLGIADKYDLFIDRNEYSYVKKLVRK